MQCCRYIDVVQAALVYDCAAILLRGEQADLNFSWSSSLVDDPRVLTPELRARLEQSKAEAATGTGRWAPDAKPSPTSESDCKRPAAGLPHNYGGQSKRQCAHETAEPASSLQQVLVTPMSNSPISGAAMAMARPPVHLHSPAPPTAATGSSTTHFLPLTTSLVKMMAQLPASFPNSKRISTAPNPNTEAVGLEWMCHQESKGGMAAHLGPSHR